MTDDAYYRLSKILDSMPNGFPPTDDGLEIRILKKIYTPEEADIATKLKMKFETAEAVAARTGMDAGYLKEMLQKMTNQGQIFGVTIGDAKIYKLVPFVFGIYEWQLNRLDRELSEMVEEYFKGSFGPEFYGHKPALMKVVPIEEEIPGGSLIEPYESAAKLIESAKSWAVGECVCKKERGLMGHKCTRPTEVCMALAPIENFFENYFWGRPISKEEAFRILKMAEDEGLVHMTSNVQNGHIYICNCCECCCGILRGMNEFGHPEVLARSNYRAVVDPDICTACGACLDRCQVRAIDIDSVAMINDRCIGCGLCVSSCPVEAIAMVRRDDAEIEDVPLDEKDWNMKRAKSRGRDDYKELL
jgi:electron transport complex protein RnfB